MAESRYTIDKTWYWARIRTLIPTMYTPVG